MLENITGSCVCSIRKHRVQLTSQREIPSVFERSGVDSGERIKTLVWTRIDRCVFDYKEIACLWNWLVLTGLSCIKPSWSTLLARCQMCVNDTGTGLLLFRTILDIFSRRHEKLSTGILWTQVAQKLRELLHVVIFVYIILSSPKACFLSNKRKDCIGISLCVALRKE